MIIVLIETDNGKIESENCFCGYIGASKNKWLDNDGYDIRLTTIDALPIIINMNHNEHILPIGSIEFMKKAADILEISLPSPINIPDSLKHYCGRKTWSCDFKDIQFPCFVKPLDDLKLFTGFVAKSVKDFELYPELIGFNGKVFCSEPIENILSEWRCFVLNGKILNCSNYSGNPLIFPDKNKIDILLEKYYGAPSGYSLDVCVSNNGTNLIEINDGWAIGNYGCDPQDYFKILKSRWLELIKNYESETV